MTLTMIFTSREYQENCRTIRSGGGKKGSGKGKAGDDGTPTRITTPLEPFIPILKGSASLKKRKSSPTPSDPTQPVKKKLKPTPKVTKGRFKGPVDYDKQCGVINEKNLPCSRSLTCKSHSMGAKRAVQGRSRLYDELLLEWNRKNNPNWVEPVKRETKAEKKEKRDREKAEKKKAAQEAAAAAGLDPNKKGAGGGGGAWGTGTKKMGKKAAAAAAAAAVAAAAEEAEELENWDEIDSEAEVNDMVKALRAAKEKGHVTVPLAVPYDAGSWFVERRERARNCRHALAGALATAPARNGVVVPAGAPRTG
jgi:SAGA-associated factor 73